jgi:hypothetical protein
MAERTMRERDEKKKRKTCDPDACMRQVEVVVVALLVIFP